MLVKNDLVKKVRFYTKIPCFSKSNSYIKINVLHVVMGDIIYFIAVELVATMISFCQVFYN